MSGYWVGKLGWIYRLQAFRKFFNSSAWVSRDLWSIFETFNQNCNEVVAKLLIRRQNVSVVLADFADYPGNSLSYFNTLILVHAQQLGDTWNQYLVELCLLGSLCDSTKSDQGSISFFPIWRENLSLNKCDNQGHDCTADQKADFLQTTARTHLDAPLVILVVVIVNLDAADALE